MEKRQEDKEVNIPNYVIFIVVFAVVVGAGMWLTYSEDSRITGIGKAVCEHYNLSFNYAKGEYTHCYLQDNATGVRRGADIWLNMDIAERLYAKPKPIPENQSNYGGK